MKELLYCSDIVQLKQELIANDMYDENIGEFKDFNNLTTIHKNSAGASLAYVRDNQLDMSKYPSLQSLGDYEDMFADTAKHDKYKSVYPYDVPITYIDEEGKQQSYMRPERIGEFA